MKKQASASKYSEVYGKLSDMTIDLEAKVKIVKKALKKCDPLGLSEVEEWRKDPSVALLFGNDPGQGVAQPTQESKPVKKHNGASENFDESNPLQRAEGRTPLTGNNDGKRKDIFAKGDRVMLDFMEARGEITKDQSRLLRGKKSSEAKEAYKGFTDRQKKEFDDARMLGFNESDALKLANLTIGYK